LRLPCRPIAKAVRIEDNHRTAHDFALVSVSLLLDPLFPDPLFPELPFPEPPFFEPLEPLSPEESSPPLSEVLLPPEGFAEFETSSGVTLTRMEA
jgi:hypothetical protein